MRQILGLAILFLIIGYYDLRAQNDQLESKIDSAEMFRAESKYDSALIFYQKVSLDALENEDVFYQMRSAVGLGGIYIDMKNSDLAILYYRRGMELAKTIGNKEFENRGFFGIGVGFHIKWLYQEKTPVNYDSAVYYYSRAKDMFIKEGERKQGADLLYNISLLNASNKDYKTARSNLDSAYSIHMEINDTRNFARDIKQFGVLFKNQRNFDSADYYLNKALYITDTAGYLDDELVVLNHLAQVYELKNDFKTANEYLKDYYLKSRNIYTSEYQDKMLQLREQYATAELELMNERQENEILRRRRFQTFTIIIAIALVIGISIWLYIVDQRRKNIKALGEKNDEINKQKIDELLQQQEIASLQGVLEGQETERKRVAIDLHDRLGGILSMVKLHFSSVEEKIDPENPSKQKFLTASELLDLAAGEVRNISHNMMSGVLAKFGLIPALEDLQTRISETGKLKVNLYTSNITGALDGEQELQLYRIVQELMSNILKHSEATETNIQLNENEDTVNLIMEDDGIGFNPEKLDVSAGIGLSNLKARVAKLNGTLHIDSGLGSGTTVSIDIPIEND